MGVLVSDLYEITSDCGEPCSGTSEHTRDKSERNCQGSDSLGADLRCSRESGGGLVLRRRGRRDAAEARQGQELGCGSPLLSSFTPIPESPRTMDCLAELVPGEAEGLVGPC